jgi:hypothetical protein
VKAGPSAKRGFILRSLCHGTQPGRRAGSTPRGALGLAQTLGANVVALSRPFLGVGLIFATVELLCRSRGSGVADGEGRGRPVMVGQAGGPSPEVLMRVVARWEDAGRRVMRVAGVLQNYGSRVRPIASGVEQVVGGSATGKDKEIGGLLDGGANELARSAAAAHEAGRIAKRLAAQVHAQAQELRGQQAHQPRAQ